MRYLTVRSRIVVAATLGVLALFSQRALADCAQPVDYDVTADGSDVTVCFTDFQDLNRGCDIGSALLRENVDTGDVVEVAANCDTSQPRCYVDTCVEDGKYRYGFALPFDCYASSCGTYYFGEIEVSGSDTSSCTSDALPYTDDPPWGTSREICGYGGDDTGIPGGDTSIMTGGDAGAGGDGGSPAGDGTKADPTLCSFAGLTMNGETLVFVINGIALLLGLVVMRRRRL